MWPDLWQIRLTRFNTGEEHLKWYEVNCTYLYSEEPVHSEDPSNKQCASIEYNGGFNVRYTPGINVKASALLEVSVLSRPLYRTLHRLLLSAVVWYFISHFDRTDLKLMSSNKLSLFLLKFNFIRYANVFFSYKDHTPFNSSALI